MDLISYILSKKSITELEDSLGDAAYLNAPEEGHDAGNDEVVLGSDSRLNNPQPPAHHTHPLADITNAGSAAGYDIPLIGDASANEVVMGDDSRLSNTRDPNPHTHLKADITDFAHTHLLNDITDLPENSAAGYSIPIMGDAAIDEVVMGNDSRLSDNRDPNPHVHTLADITDAGTSAGLDYSNLVTAGDSTHLVTGEAVAAAIAALPEPMIFKGSLGVGGTISSLPIDGSATKGDTYKVITAGTYAGQVSKIGDTFICDSKTSVANTWIYIPSGDEPSGTVISVGIAAGNNGITVGTSVGNNDPITESGTLSVSHADTSSQASSDNSGRTYIQNITLDDYGHVTALSSATETVVNTDRYVDNAAFEYDSTNDNIKMTLTRAGSDSATVVDNIPVVSASSAGVVPKGDTVSTQSQSTKFLREDGTWAEPSYTIDTNTTYAFGTGDNNGQIKVTPSAGGGSAYNVDVKGLGSAAYITSTTLGGYGITDAKIENGTITLGSDSITPLTSFTETDPTVPAWAKASTKPSYSYSEITDTPTIPTKVSDLTNDSGFVTTDEKVLVTKTESTTSATNYIPIVKNDTANPQKPDITDGFRVNTARGTVSAVGEVGLYLGNSIASGTAGNMRGRILIYGTGNKYTYIIPSNPTDHINVTLPASTGTIALTSQITDKKVTPVDLTHPTSETVYRPLIVPNADPTTNRQPNYSSLAWQFVMANGTASAKGWSSIRIGNSTASGTANNMQGYLRLYGANSYYVSLEADTLTADRAIKLPNAAGTIALTSSTVEKANAIATAAGTTNSSRVVFFAYDGDTTKVAYDTDFKYNPSTNDLTVSKINGVTPVLTDTKVTSSANHYTPATASGSDVSASASGATAAWSIDVVKGVTLNTDGKGHVTGLSVTSGKIPANPNVDIRKSFYATCAAASATTPKIATLDNSAGWSLISGVVVGVKYTNSNNASSVTLNVNNTGNKSIVFNGSVYTGTEPRITGWAGHVIWYMYDGTNWVYMCNDSIYYNSTYNFSGTTFYSGNSSTAEHNANSILKNGNYYYSSNGPAKSLGASTDDGALYAQSYSDSWVGQIAQDYRNGNLFVRGKNNGTWTSWGAIFSDQFQAITATSSANVSLNTYKTPGRYSCTSNATSAYFTNQPITAGTAFNLSVERVLNSTTYLRQYYWNHSNTNLYVRVSTDSGSTWGAWRNLAANDNTDTKVKQSASTTSNWRKVLLHYQSDAASTTAVTTSTNEVYAAVGVSVQPSTGTLAATKFSGPLEGNATSATKATQDGSGNTITSTYFKKAGDTISGATTVNAAITFGANDSYGIFTTTNNYCCIGSIDKCFYRAYINQLYLGKASTATGKIYLYSGSHAYRTSISPGTSLTTDRDFVFPNDIGGTIALTSDFGKYIYQNSATVAAGTGWRASNASVTLPAGTYTIIVWAAFNSNTNCLEGCSILVGSTTYNQSIVNMTYTQATNVQSMCRVTLSSSTVCKAQVYSAASKEVWCGILAIKTP